MVRVTTAVSFVSKYSDNEKSQDVAVPMWFRGGCSSGTGGMNGATGTETSERKTREQWWKSEMQRMRYDERAGRRRVSEEL